MGGKKKNQEFQKEGRKLRVRKKLKWKKEGKRGIKRGGEEKRWKREIKREKGRERERKEVKRDK